jgi:hypothetical protein
MGAEASPETPDFPVVIVCLTPGIEDMLVYREAGTSGLLYTI